MNDRRPMIWGRCSMAWDKRMLGGLLKRARTWLPVLGGALVLLSATGCSRVFYHHRADAEVAEVVGCNIANPGRGPLANFTIDVDPRSRMSSPYSEDWPPMPPDDPTSHVLMECVDCKRGARVWRRYGTTGQVANPQWRRFLPLDADGALVLDRNASVSMALLQSPDYQGELEDLYLSALDVTFERFRFDTQFFGGSSLFYTANGRNRPGSSGRSVLDVNVLDPANRLRAERLFAAGGEAVVGLANSFVWEFSGPDRHSTSTLLDFALIQPLLRGAGRARVMERLTLSERTLVANIRQMERFRRGFYVQVVTGRSAGAGPSRRGGVFGTSGLEGFTGVGGGGFGSLGGGGAAFGGGAAGAAGAGGFLGLVQDAQEIRNLAANAAGLRTSVDQLQAAHEAGRIDRFQVDLTRQALYNTESRLLTRRAAYRSRLDSFKISLGLPPDLDLHVEDRDLDQFQLLDPTLDRLQSDAKRWLDTLRSHRQDAAGPPLAEWVGQAVALGRRAESHVGIVLQDYAKLQRALPTRRRTLRELAARREVATGSVDRSALDVGALDWRVKALQQDLNQAKTRIDATWEKIQVLAQGGPAAAPQADIRRSLIDLGLELSDALFELSLLQARTRLDAVVIDPVKLADTTALDIARSYRRDWMNARASLVDRWRLIQFNANDLRSGLDVTFSGDIRNTGSNPVKLDDSTGRLRVGVEFDAPLTRLAERNVYRQALIEYQQARRQYYTFVDRVDQTLRNTLRTMRLNELNFELRRQAVFVGISQVDLARLRLLRPPKSGETSELGATTARDLVTALADLLSVQNDFLSVWIDYHVQRLLLDFNLGTMQLDEQGMWIDPGSAVGTVDPTGGPWRLSPQGKGPEVIRPTKPGGGEQPPVEELPAPPSTRVTSDGRPTIIS